jgi:3-oxoacyl-[acyl-carrier-protein] synthase-1
LKIFTVADNIISPLGFTTSENYAALAAGRSGITAIADSTLYPESFYGAQINKYKVKEEFSFEKSANYSYLEKLFILSIKGVLDIFPGLNKNRTLLLISSTKGNIDLLSRNIAINETDACLTLPAMARKLSNFFGLTTEPLVVSNACISGVSAILIAKKLIKMGLYDNVVVAGGDLLSEFVVSGFQCLKAISDKPCRPYDEARNGVTLGEACGTILLSNDPELCHDKNAFSVVAGGGQSNDANHISGPSRTGKGLKLAVQKALNSSGIKLSDLAYINAHGTATLYNDEMEAVAFSDLEMDGIPVNSMKGYFGHTLGASGVIESIMAVRQLNSGLFFSTKGYEIPGTTRKLNILNQNATIQNPAFVLKTASGFGGCNGAIVFGKS